MKPRVVLLSAFLSPFRSGAEACAEEVPLRLAGQFDFTLVTAKLRSDLPRRDLLQGRIPVRRVGFGCALDKWLYPFLAPIAVWRLRPDIVHGVLETFAGLALYFCRFVSPRAKRFLTLQTTNRSFLKGWIVRSPHCVTAISRALQEIAQKLGRDDVSVIPNGIDYLGIRSACAEHAKVPRRVLFVGRLERMKGVDLLLRTLAELNAIFDVQHATLRVVGDGSQRCRLESLVRELGIAQQVRFLGYLPAPAVYREYAQAEIFCGLSRSEALGNVFLEAQAAGCAVLGTRVGGIPEIVEDGVTGVLVSPEDAEAAVRALTLLLRDADFRSRLVRGGVRRAERYDWGEVAGRYASVYADLLTPPV